MCNRNHLRYKLILSISLSTSSLSESAKFEQRTDTNFRDAEQGNVDAQLNLGNIYMLGLGVTQDYKTALRWFKLGAEQGNVNAQFSLGILYANGFGVTQDYARAYMWWNIAALKGNTNAVAGRTAVQNVMTPTQIENAQVLASKCMEKDFKGC